MFSHNSFASLMFGTRNEIFQHKFWHIPQISRALCFSRKKYNMTHLTGFPVKPEISHKPFCSKASPRLQERGGLGKLGRGGVD